MIDPRADVHSSAHIAPDVHVGPWTFIGADVEIGEGSWVGPHVVINGPTQIGKHNKIFQFSSIGDAPQDLGYAGEPTRLEIGDGNVFREYCTIHRGTVKGGGITQIGDQNFLMAYSHIGHDCKIGDHCIFVNYAALSGHAVVQNYAIIGAYSAVHQFCTVGRHAFIARATYVTKDVLPYVMVAGYTASVYGINVVGLKRRGFTSETIESLKRAYKIIFRKDLIVSHAIEALGPMLIECPEVQDLIDLLQSSERGIVR